jgi:hypothetical protein
MESPHGLVVIVHGIGRQAELQTLKTFLEGCTADLDFPSTATRAQLAYQLRTNGRVNVPEVGLAFSEYSYSREIAQHLDYAEAEPKAWVRSLRNRLREINRNRGGPKDISFLELEFVIDDLVLAATLARLIAVRLRVQADPLRYVALGFIQQIQLYIDHDIYRDEIDRKFQVFIEGVAGDPAVAGRGLNLAAHSLGTVVTLRAILNAARDNKPWVKSVKTFSTFGSPVDLIFLLFPELFAEVKDYKGPPIAWVNYSFGNDPVASDLALVRKWAATKCPGLFVANDPGEVDLGAGSMATAHTDYWSDRFMLDEICVRAREDGTSAPVAPVVASKSRVRSRSTAFKYGSMAAAVVVAWLIMVWWEENVKETDGVRTMLGNPFEQLGVWFALWLMVWSHVKCWTAPRWPRLGYFAICAAAGLGLAEFLPGLSILPGLMPASWTQLDHPLRPDDEWWELGNLILLFVPGSALLGVIGVSFRKLVAKQKVALFAGLALGFVIFSLFCGTRNNPSNVMEEVGILLLALGLWWLSVLLSRIDEVFRHFIGARDHLDKLSALWGTESEPVEFRRKGTVEKRD